VALGEARRAKGASADRARGLLTAARQPSFAAMAAYSRPPSISRDAVNRSGCAALVAQRFSSPGHRPAFGRDFTANETIGRHRVVLLTDALWRRRFGADGSIVAAR
jgi:hypothetical protein